MGKKKVNPNNLPGSWDEAYERKLRGHGDGFTDSINLLVFVMMDKFAASYEDVSCVMYDIEEGLGQFGAGNRLEDIEERMTRKYGLSFPKMPPNFAIPQKRQCTKKDEKRAYRSGYMTAERVVLTLAARSLLWDGADPEWIVELRKKYDYQADALREKRISSGDIEDVVKGEYEVEFEVADVVLHSAHRNEYHDVWLERKKKREVTK